MGKSKKKVLEEAPRNRHQDSVDEFEVPVATRAVVKTTRSTSTRRGGGLRRFLSRSSRRTVSAPRPTQAAAAAAEEDAPKMHLPDRRLENGTLDAAATHLEEAFEAAQDDDKDDDNNEEEATDKVSELASPAPTEPLVVQLEIGTRDIPLEECKAEEPQQDEEEEEASFLARSIASFPSLDQVLFQLALAGELDGGQTATTTAATTSAAKKELPTVNDDDKANDGDEKNERTVTVPEEQQEETKEESKETDNNNDDRLINDSSFFGTAVPGILQSLSCADGCSLDYWDSTCKDVNKNMNDDEKVLPWVKVKSFEEYEDHVMDVPILLKSCNQYLDVYAVEGSGKQGEGTTPESPSNTKGGLEAVLTLPEV